MLPPGLVLRQPAFSQAVHEHRRSRRSASALRRLRSRALGRRPLVGRQRSHAGAVGRRLCAREPRRVVAVLAGAVRGAQRAAARELLPRVLRALLEPVEPRPAASRVPVAGPVEAELFRARVSRALLGLQRRRGLRSHGARRSRLLEDGRGSQARRPHHAPHQLRALRSARAAHGLACRRAGPRAGGARRQGHDRQRARLGSRRERLVLELPAGPLPALPRRGAGDAELRDVVVRPGAERRYVLEHLDELVVRRVRTSRNLFPRGQEGLFSPEMPAEERDAPDPRDRAQRPRVRRPGTRCRCRWRRRGPAPNALRAAPVLLRVYVAATSKGYEVMPGGLTRVADGIGSAAPRGSRSATSARTRGCSPINPSSSSACSRNARRASACTAAAATCRAARRTTCSGSAATRSAPRAPCACCAAW